MTNILFKLDKGQNRCYNCKVPYADMAELADALDLGSSGKPWRFKSSYPHHQQISAF